MVSFISPINNRKVLISRSFINDQIRGKSKEQILALIKNFNEMGRTPLQSGLSSGQRQRALHNSRRNRAIAQGLKERIGLPTGGIGQQTERAEIIAPSRIEDEVTKLTESMKGEQVSTLESQFEIGQLGSVTAPSLGLPPKEFSTIQVKIEQINFPTTLGDFAEVRGDVRVNHLNPVLLSNTGFPVILRIIVHDLLGTGQTVLNKQRQLTKSIPSFDIGYGIRIPSNRFRIEMAAFLPDGSPISTVFNETFTNDITPPKTFKNCSCCGDILRIEATLPCPACNKCPDENQVCHCPNAPDTVVGKGQPCPNCPDDKIDLTPNIFDKGIVALLAVAALMPRGKKK